MVDSPGWWMCMRVRNGKQEVKKSEAQAKPRKESEFEGRAEVRLANTACRGYPWFFLNFFLRRNLNDYEETRIKNLLSRVY